MSTQPVLWTALAAALAVAACQSSISPDAGQAAPAATPTLAVAPAPPPAPARGEGRAAGESEGRAAAAPARGTTPAVPANLENAMSDMNRMLNAIKAEAADPAKSEQTLKDIITLERDTAISKLLIPPAVNRMTADEKAKAIVSYRAMMSGLARTLLDLEDAVTDKKPDDIKKLIAQLEEIEKQGHAEFKPAGD